MEVDEKHLIQRILGGKTDEYSYFLDRYGREVYAVAVRLLGHAQDAEEVTQDAFVSAFQHLDDYRPELPFATWVCRMAYNRAISVLRKKKRLPKSSDMPEDQLSSVTDEMVVSAFSDTSDERIQLLEQAVEQLAVDDQTLISLFYHHGKPLKEIAYILGLDANSQRSVAMLATRISRIRKKLYVIIKQMEEKYER